METVRNIKPQHTKILSFSKSPIENIKETYEIIGEKNSIEK
jgi:hypothetical protein